MVGGEVLTELDWYTSSLVRATILPCPPPPLAELPNKKFIKFKVTPWPPEKIPHRSLS